MVFDWDEHNLGHIGEHGLTRADVEHALLGRTLHLNIEIRSGKERVSRLGRSLNGRIVYVVTTVRGPKVRPVTAFWAKQTFAGLYVARYGDADETRSS